MLPMTALANKGWLTFLLALPIVSGCERALVYGDRSGFNLAIRSDPAESAPLEVNAGLQRRVIGFVPASESDQNAPAKGEAVNMFSRFDLKQHRDSNTVFGGKLTIGTAFASGQAALYVAEKPEVVAAITGSPEFTLTDVPEDRGVANKLYTFASSSADNARKYLELAAARGLIVSPGLTLNAQAVGTITNPKNSEGNKLIANELNL